MQEGGTKSNLVWKLRKKVTGQKEINSYDTVDEDGNKNNKPRGSKKSYS